MRPGRPKQFNEVEVLERAMNLFWLRGYEATGMADLLREMGISRQSLYDTFGSKRGLFLRVIEHYRTTQLARALALLERDGSPRANVRDVLGFFEALALDARCRGCLVANALVELGPHDPEVAALLGETLELLRAGIERALVRAREAGELAAHKSPGELSSALANSLVGLAVTGKLPLDRSAIRAVYSGTLSMLD